MFVCWRSIDRDQYRNTEMIASLNSNAQCVSVMYDCAYEGASRGLVARWIMYNNTNTTSDTNLQQITYLIRVIIIFTKLANKNNFEIWRQWHSRLVLRSWFSKQPSIAAQFCVRMACTQTVCTLVYTLSTRVQSSSFKMFRSLNLISYFQNWCGRYRSQVTPIHD